ncbi:cytochrome P450 [Crossiella sp. SN42]|uniref:cytochrome P450 n=1 Tax=Crossiella sp. SN42 TaxID=2944808 RepID=UPI00207CCEC2|nr:cytochrome P450 [Crossiella sp. SN42]MCO1576911.1 cytochrome P450 [Crossiella sp. SN42]
MTTLPYPAARAEGCPFDPPPALRALREHTPLTRVRLADGSTPWLVTRHAEQRTLLADPRLSSDPASPGFPAGVPISADAGISFILKDDPEHARLRRMVTAPFAVKRIEAMRPVVQRIVDEHIDALLTGPKPVDLVRAFALPVPSLVICDLLGVPYTDHDFFQRHSNTLINREAGAAERAAAGGELFRYLDELIGAKLASPGDDLLSGLTERIHRGELTRGEAGQMGVLMLVAGHETTANMIALGTLALLEHPGQLALLRSSEDPELIASAVEELLRYLHITHNGRRRAVTADLEVAGQTIRAGEGVILAGDLGNRDPSVFPDPDRLDLRRNPRRHVAFGFGVHQCLGQTLARLELQVVYGTLYRRIPTLRLAAPVAEIPFKHDGSVYGVYRLPVTW